jgi:hypothetical protein
MHSLKKTRWLSVVAMLFGFVVGVLLAAVPSSTPAGDAAAKEDSAKNDSVKAAAKDEKAKDDKSKDNKSKDDKAKDAKAKDDKAKDDKAKDAKAKDDKSKDKADKDASKKSDAGKDASKKNAKKDDDDDDDDDDDVADNSYCLVCHLNYGKEKLSAIHRAKGVGCTKCHGESEKHSGDEDGLTAPEVIFAHEDVDKFCMTCHEKEKIAKSENHKEVFDSKVSAEEHLVCTECHGENHKMAVRTRKWDKKTRKLLSDDGVRMMYKNSPATEGVPEASKKKEEEKK